MQSTTNYGLKKPELTDNVKISDFNENADIVDTQLKARADAQTAHVAAADPHTQYALDTDLSNLAGAGRTTETVKGIFDAAAAHLADLAPHGSTSAATASKLIIRDVAGRAKVAAPSASDDIARKDTVDNAIAALVNSSPTTLDTLKELADALGDDPNYAATTAALIGDKASQVALDATNAVVASHLADIATDTELGHIILSDMPWRKIASITVSQDTQQVDFINIPADYKMLKIVFSTYNAQSFAADLNLVLNDDTTAKYYRELLTISGTTAVATTSSALFNYPITRMCGTESIGHILINNNLATKSKGILYDLAYSQFRYSGSGTYNEVTTLINKISFICGSSATIAAGSKLVLMGVK